MNTKLKGYILGAIAAATYGMNPLFALPLYKGGMNPDSALLFRYILALPILAVMIKIRGKDFKINRKEFLGLLFLGIMTSFSSLGLFESYRYMDAGIASTLLFIYPIFVALIMIFLFKEKINVITIVCIILALSGIGLLYRGRDGATLSFIGTLLVAISLLTYAIYIVCVNRSVLKEMAALKVTFYVLLFGSFLFIGRIGCGVELNIPDKWYLWLNVFALAIFPTTISFLCTTKAIHYIGSTATAILGALEPLTAIFFGIIVFGEKLTLQNGIGMFLIIFAVTLVIAGGKISAYMIRFRKLFPVLRRDK